MYYEISPSDLATRSYSRRCWHVRVALDVNDEDKEETEARERNVCYKLRKYELQLLSYVRTSRADFQKHHSSEFGNSDCPQTRTSL